MKTLECCSIPCEILPQCLTGTIRHFITITITITATFILSVTITIPIFQCPGRLLATCGDGSIIQEYIIFDANQALPLDLIEFTVATAANAGQVTEVIAAPVNGGTK